MNERNELNEKNFRRISVVNMALTPPFLLIFTWPYHMAGQIFGFDAIIIYPGALLFALPFTITLLHGHVTLALGQLHRHHYYDWLGERPYTFGLFYHPVLVSTRFRLVLLVLSFLIFMTGYLR